MKISKDLSKAQAMITYDPHLKYLEWILSDEKILDESGRYQYQTIKRPGCSGLREECVAFYWGAKWATEQMKK